MMAEASQPTVPKTPGSANVSASGREGRHRQKFGLVKHGARQSMEQYINRLIEMTRHHTLLPAEFLDRKLRLESTRMKARAKAKDITFSFQPFIVLANVWYLRPLCALIGIVLIIYGLLNLAAMVTLGVDPYRHYRLTALARRNPSPLGPRPPGPGVGGFGLFSRKSKEMGLLQMTAAKDRPTYSNITADSMTLSFPGKVPTSSYNGWYLVTSNESVDHDPTLLILEGSNDEVTWNMVGSSSYANWGRSNIFANRTRDFCPRERNQEVYFLARALWAAYFGYAVTWNCTGGVFLFVFVGFATGYMRYIPLSIRIGTFALSISSLAAGAGYAVTEYGDPVENHLSATYFVAAGIGYFICAFALAAFPKYPDFCMMVFSAYSITVSSTLWEPSLSPTTIALAFIWLIGFLIFVNRLLVYHKAEILIRKLRVVYDDIWIRVIDQPNAVRDLSVLNEVVRRISNTTEGKTAAQFNLRVLEDEATDSSLTMQGRNLNELSSINSCMISRLDNEPRAGSSEDVVRDSLAALSINQSAKRPLYDRVFSTFWKYSSTFYDFRRRVLRTSLLHDLGNPALTESEKQSGNAQESAKNGRKTPAWVYEGLMSSIAEGRNVYRANENSPVTSLDQLYSQASLLNGLMQSLVCSLAMRCRGRLPVDAKDGDEEEGEKLSFTKLKSIDRCLAKIDGCYSGNISLLIDLCRERIVFDTIQDLTHCLVALSKEEAVEILRIKSTMTNNGLDGQISSGFRFVLVNLRIQTKETVRLCINGHVCELQLVLLPFAQALNKELHSDYIRCRNSVNGVLSRAFGKVTRTSIRGRKLSLQHHLDDSPDIPQDPQLEEVDQRFLWQTQLYDDVGDYDQSSAHEMPEEMSLAQPCIQDHTPTGQPASVSVCTASGEANLPSASAGSQPYQGGDSTVASSGVVSHQTEPRRRGSLLRGNPRVYENDGGEQRREHRWSTSWGITVDGNIVDTLEALSRVVSLGFANVMDFNMSKTQNLGLESASASGMLFISRPITASSVRPFYQLVFLLAGIWLIANSVINETVSPVAPLTKARHFQFRNILARNGTKATTPGVSSFSVDDLPKTFGTAHEQKFLWRAIELESAPGTFDHEAHDMFLSSRIVRGPSIFVSYGKDIEACGWTLEGDIESSNFEVYFSMSEPPEGGSAADIPRDYWKVLGTPSWGFRTVMKPKFIKNGVGQDEYAVGHSVFAQNLEWHYDLPAPPEGESGTLVFTPAWTGSLMSVMGDVDMITGLGFLSYTFFGILRKATSARYSLLTFIFIGICTFAWGIGLNDGLSIIAPILSIYLAVHIVFFLAILIEKYFIYLCFIAGTVALSGHSLFALSGVQAPGPGYLTNEPGYMMLSFIPVFFFVFPLGLFVFRVKDVVTARRLVMQDKAEYDKLWSEEVAKDEDGASIKHLGEVVRMLGLDVASNQTYSSNMIQMDRKWIGLNKGNRSRRVAPSPECNHGKEHLFHEELQSYPIKMTIDPRSPVKSLDQLYMQAIVANAILLDKVKDWAENSNGYFQRRADVMDGGGDQVSEGDSEERFIKWIEVKDDLAAQQTIKWPPIKRHQRCIEKLTRSYNSDVSKLVDISRHNIFFDSFADLTMCLGRIVTDLDVRVERVKSRLTTKYDAAATAGYRDVALNVRALSAKACALGCDTHMCEVQLILKSFGNLRNAQGHERYVKFRDMRGE